MKKLFALTLTTAILAASAVPTFAQGRNRTCNSRTYSSRTYDSRTYYDNRAYYDNQSYYDYGYRNRSVWDRHRDKLTVAIGTGAGAAIGAVTGGRRGAAIGALLGAGSSALYTYKIRNRRYRY
jgi:YmgG-like glycine-zipper protein